MIAEDPAFRQSAWLLKNGTPFVAAFGLSPEALPELDPEERAALAIVLQEMEGSEFNWDEGQFKERRTS